MDHRRRSVLKSLAGGAAAAALGGCGGSDAAQAPAPNPVPAPKRSWRMGFSPNPPRPEVAAVLKGIDLWSSRAEIAILHEELPWADLLAGMTPDAILDRDKVALVRYLRDKGLSLVFMADLTDGLSRADEAPALRKAGRSLTEPAVRQLYRDYVLAVERKLAPEWLGLAAETNLIRAAAPAAVYNAAVRATNDAEADLRSASAASRRFVSVQVETAWGVLGGGTGAFAGIDRDFADFAFTSMLGLSSYPYFGYTQPEDIPADYYSRLLAARGLPALVTEGGWTSANVGALHSSPDLQARYVTRHAQLLDSINALALLQLEFADIDLASLPAPVPANLPLFTAIGLTDSQFTPKPALARWDALFARPRG